ncbi:AbiH family protein [Acinetobacter sp. BY484]|uniref:AbiH family protein n=1 Tax=Acinetobacter sp. BY484 TaxID=2820674 RepID=UPI001C216C47|nr:AbiH family protein [Acinetobacter sp. BY484]
MNILIVGNGFDLSHYLPTKYDHFMDVMNAIETKDTGSLPKNLHEKKIQEWIRLLEQTFDKKVEAETDKKFMSFEQLFAGNRDPDFIAKTKEFYLTENINLSKKDVIQLQYRLALNCWYEFFKDHVKEVRTWIDFENKIDEALRVVARFIENIEEKIEKAGGFSTEVYFSGDSNEWQIFLTRENCNILEKLGILESGYFIDETDNDEYGRTYTNIHKVNDSDIGDFRFYIKGENIQFLLGYKKFNSDILISNLVKKLEEFIKIFNLYLDLIVNKINSNNNIQISSNDWTNPDKIYSFNYTNTYQRIYDSVDVDYLHGSHGEFQNIVLGISQLEDESLKKLKAYGFTKYHQKLFKDTHYLFLDGYKRKLKETLEKYKKHKSHNYPNNQIEQEREEHFLKIMKLDLNFNIWGHSLDVSDKDYIIDLFSLNDEIDRNVRVTVYYFDRLAKFSLLNNLLAILGKEKVEHWMKNKWLQFKQNPEIKFQTEERAELEDVS